MDLFDIVRSAPPPKNVREKSSASNRDSSKRSLTPSSEATLVEVIDSDTNDDLPSSSRKHNLDKEKKKLKLMAESKKSKSTCGSISDNSDDENGDKNAAEKSDTNDDGILIDSDDDQAQPQPLKTKAEQKMFAEGPMSSKGRKQKQLGNSRAKRCVVRIKRLSQEEINRLTTSISQKRITKRGRPRKTIESPASDSPIPSKKPKSSPTTIGSSGGSKVFIKVTGLQNGSNQQRATDSQLHKVNTPPPKLGRNQKNNQPSAVQKDLSERYGARFFKCVVKMKRMKDISVPQPKRSHNKSVSFNESIEIFGSKSRKSSYMVTSSVSTSGAHKTRASSTPKSDANRASASTLRDSTVRSSTSSYSTSGRSIWKTCSSTPVRMASATSTSALSFPGYSASSRAKSIISISSETIISHTVSSAKAVATTTSKLSAGTFESRSAKSISSSSKPSTSGVFTSGFSKSSGSKSNSFKASTPKSDASKHADSTPTRLQRVDATGNVLEDIDLGPNTPSLDHSRNKSSNRKRSSSTSCNGGGRAKKSSRTHLSGDNHDEEYIVPTEQSAAGSNQTQPPNVRHHKSSHHGSSGCSKRSSGSSSGGRSKIQRRPSLYVPVTGLASLSIKDHQDEEGETIDIETDSGNDVLSTGKSQAEKPTTLTNEQPEAMDQTISDPMPVKPELKPEEAAEPEPAVPEPAELELEEPEPAKPEAEEPEPEEPQPEEPEPAEPEPKEPEPAEPELEEPEPAEPGPEESMPDMPEPENPVAIPEPPASIVPGDVSPFSLAIIDDVTSSDDILRIHTSIEDVRDLYTPPVRQSTSTLLRPPINHSPRYESPESESSFKSANELDGNSTTLNDDDRTQSPSSQRLQISTPSTPRNEITPSPPPVSPQQPNTLDGTDEAATGSAETANTNTNNSNDSTTNTTNMPSGSPSGEEIPNLDDVELRFWNRTPTPTLQNLPNLSTNQNNRHAISETWRM